MGADQIIMSVEKETYIYDREHIHNELSAREILPFIWKIINPQSVADFGCGLGNWLSVAKTMGAKQIVGVDREYVLANDMYIPRENFIPHNLCEPFDLKRKFDLAICVEVAEHLPEECALNLVKTLTVHADTILFSAALPHQGGQKHINEKPLDYWVKLFQAHGFSFYDGLRQEFWNNPRVHFWYRQNCFLVSRNNLTELWGLPLAKNSYLHPELYQLYQAWHKQLAISEHDDLRKERDDLRKERDLSSRKATRLEARLSQVYASSSWRLTAPLRAVGGVSLPWPGAKRTRSSD